MEERCSILKGKESGGGSEEERRRRVKGGGGLGHRSDEVLRRDLTWIKCGQKYDRRVYRCIFSDDLKWLF